MLANSPILTYLSAFYAQISQFNAFFRLFSGEARTTHYYTTYKIKRPIRCIIRRNLHLPL